MNKTDENLLDCFHDTPSDLVFWSFRYFLGRSSAATCCFARSLATAWPYLGTRVQGCIRREIEAEFSTGVNLTNIDRAAWQLVRDAYGEGLT